MSQTFLLENEYLKVIFDETGHITSFFCKDTGTDVISSTVEDSFFMNLGNDICKENLVWGHEQTLTVSATDTSVSFYADRLKIDNGRSDAGDVDISVTLTATLNGDEIIFSGECDNRTDMWVLDCEWPRLGKIKSLGNGKPSLYWPDQPGRLYHNIGDRLGYAYTHRENGSNTMRATYPGPAMLGMMALLDKKSSLYMMTCDPTFIACELKVIGYPDDVGAVTLTVNKNLCLKKGKLAIPDVRVKCYRGDWHKGAEEYAEFMKPYRPIAARPDWAKEMTGYFLVINKQQFGYEMWDYTTLPKLWELAKAHGCDTVGLFGWYQTGHDNNYPDLEVSTSMGGTEELKRGIEKIHEDGGKVTLYYQGHLIDVESDYYRNREGKRIASKNIWGSDYVEFYSKNHRSDFLGHFSRKMFSLACPSCPEWRNMMYGREKWIASLGADGTLYDQIGGMPPNICFNESHPHPGNNPARALTGGQTELVHHLQKEAKEISPNFIFMSEHICDLYSSSLDVIHGIGNMPGGRGDRTENSSVTVFPEVFRYCFPDAMLTLRNPCPFIERRAVNYAFVYGFVVEIEVRYRADREDILADKFADKREWVYKVAQLRKKYASSIPHGRFVDTCGIENDDPLLFAKCYELTDGRLAVTFWNDTDEAKVPRIAVAGRKLVSFETTEKAADTLLPIEANGVAVAIYE